MMLFIIVLAIVVAFAYGWFYAPKGTLTKITSTVLLGITAAHEWLTDQWFMLRELVPPDYGPWLILGFFGLTVAAAFFRTGRR